MKSEKEAEREREREREEESEKGRKAYENPYIVCEQYNRYSFICTSRRVIIDRTI